MKYLELYLIVINIVALVLCGFDKQLAIAKAQRISEKSLLTSCVLGGGFGFMLGMKLFRHKTKHKQFSVGVPIICIVWIAIIGFFYFA